MRRRRPVKFTPVPPLPPGSPDFVDDHARFLALEARKRAVVHMLEYDITPQSVRAVDQVVGNLKIAKMLYAHGVTTPEQAEPVVREMLSTGTVTLPRPQFRRFG